MGTLVGTNPQFDGSAKQWPSFKQQMLRLADAKDFTYMLEGGDIICKMFQEANAAAARSKTAGKTGTMSLDIESYEPKEVEAEFRKTSVLTSVALAVRGNRKEKLGENWADHEKCVMSEDDLIEAHKVLDVKYLREMNRLLVKMLHDAVFSGRSETIAITRLRSILKTPQVAKTIAGEEIGDEEQWSTMPWKMPSVQIFAKLIYRFEGMTEMINGAFMDDLGELLSSITGHQRKTLYEIDQEFEKMCEMLVKNFSSIESLMPFLRSSLRHTMIRRLSKVGNDKEAWKKERST